MPHRTGLPSAQNIPRDKASLLGRTGADSLAGNKAKPKPSSSSAATCFLRQSCYYMHAALVFLHFCLVGVAIRHTERKAIVSISSNDTVLTTALSASLQAFYTLYATLLVYITQRLAISRGLFQYQTLTATHDGMRAWIGLGTACDCLWNQTKLATTPLKVFCVAIYLSCIAALHIASSSIMQFQNFNNTITTSVSTALGWPDNSWFSVAEYQTYNSSSTTTWNAISSVAPFVANLSGISTAGLTGSTVYDVLALNGGTGNATVNATTVNVQCGVITGGAYNATSAVITFPPSPNGFQQSFTPYIDQVIDFGSPGSNVVFMVTTALNASSALLETAAITLPWYHFESSTNLTAVPSVLNMYMVSCNVSIVQASATVDVQSNKLLAIGSPEPSFSSEWSAVSSDSLFVSSDSPPNASWASYPFSYAPTSNVKINDAACVGEGCTPQYSLNVAEVYFMQLLGLNATQINPYLGAAAYNIPAYVSDTTPSSTLSASQMEIALSRLLASMIWTAGLLGEASGGFDRLTGSTAITQPVLQMRLNINWIPLSVALGASVMLLALSIYMIGLGSDGVGKGNSVYGMGVLELIWLASRSPELREGVGGVTNPTADNLRAAGMFDVRLADVGREDDEETYDLYKHKLVLDLTSDATLADRSGELFSKGGVSSQENEYISRIHWILHDGKCSSVSSQPSAQCKIPDGLTHTERFQRLEAEVSNIVPLFSLANHRKRSPRLKEPS
ncbi:hypothetical protein BV22DRAFT_790915 [Leucogyrophana mollusca]|uniref:Uncharacterized protein n=1 Tax=Leucogyrophana mollusca TaxID=85980 RepID=A0ACB8B5S3_9AGAM|nr:hypothetical protein BV22DRAFT_790915 [Leucogyrophana mollusca]